MVILLSLLPLWLVGSTALSIWLWDQGRQKQAKTERDQFRTPISARGLEQDLRKIVEVAGPRNTGSEQGATGMRRVAALIQGSLGPANAGYELEIFPGPETPRGSWPIVLARLAGEGEGIALVAGYDAAPGSVGVEFNATGLASVLALAQAMAGEKPGRPVTFAFVPHAYDAGAPVDDAMRRLVGAIGRVGALWVVEATGRSRELSVSSSDAALLAPFAGRARVDEGPSEDPGFAERLSAAGLAALRITTTGSSAPAGGPDDRLPDPAVHAVATTRLAELARAAASAR